jgi:hypothetical protein
MPEVTIGKETFFKCTEEDPYTPEKAGPLRTIHTGAYEDGDWNDEIAYMKCRACQHSWKEVIPS